LLYFKSLSQTQTPEEELRLQYIVYSSIDFFELRAEAKKQDFFVGLLMPIEEFRVYVCVAACLIYSDLLL
jgi:hypothetical protein